MLELQGVLGRCCGRCRDLLGCSHQVSFWISRGFESLWQLYLEGVDLLCCSHQVRLVLEGSGGDVLGLKGVCLEEAGLLHCSTAQARLCLRWVCAGAVPGEYGLRA